MEYIKTYEKFTYTSLKPEIKEEIQKQVEKYKTFAEERLSTYSGQVDGMGQPFAYVKGAPHEKDGKIVFDIKWGIKYDSNLTKTNVTEISLDKKTLEKEINKVKTEL